MGNLRSVWRAWERAGAEVRMVTEPAGVAGCDALVFPGQGAIMDCMTRLEQTGFAGVIKDWIDRDRPFFGICLGLQALFTHSEEGDTPGLGIFPGRVMRFRLSPAYKIPHMGWNAVRWTRELPPNRGLRSGVDELYFVHSYHAVPSEPDLAWGLTEYGGAEFVSAIARGRCHATQFHPEKSQAVGLTVYRQFLATL